MLFDQGGYVVCHCPLSYEVVEVETEEGEVVKVEVYEVSSVEGAPVVARAVELIVSLGVVDGVVVATLSEEVV